MKSSDKKYRHGFTEPVDYFQNLEQHLLHKDQTSELPNDLGFRLPEGYFSSFESRISAKLLKAEIPIEKISWFKRKEIKYAVAIAACTLFIFSTIRLNSTKHGSIESLDQTTIANYLEEGNEKIDYFDLMALYGDEEIGDLNFENQSFSDADLEEYLINTMDDTTLLIE